MVVAASNGSPSRTTSAARRHSATKSPCTAASTITRSLAQQTWPAFQYAP